MHSHLCPQLPLPHSLHACSTRGVCLQELVQVETLAQLGALLLLFGLGMELSLSKLRSVWNVAVLGGALQVWAMCKSTSLLRSAVCCDRVAAAMLAISP